MVFPSFTYVWHDNLANIFGLVFRAWLILRLLLHRVVRFFFSYIAFFHFLRRLCNLDPFLLWFICWCVSVSYYCISVFCTFCIFICLAVFPLSSICICMFWLYFHLVTKCESSSRLLKYVALLYSISFAACSLLVSRACPFCLVKGCKGVLFSEGVSKSLHSGIPGCIPEYIWPKQPVWYSGTYPGIKTIRFGTRLHTQVWPKQQGLVKTTRLGTRVHIRVHV